MQVGRATYPLALHKFFIPSSQLARLTTRARRPSNARTLTEGPPSAQRESGTDGGQLDIGLWTPGQLCCRMLVALNVVMVDIDWQGLGISLPRKETQLDWKPSIG